MYTIMVSNSEVNLHVDQLGQHRFSMYKNLQTKSDIVVLKNSQIDLKTLKIIIHLKIV